MLPILCKRVFSYIVAKGTRKTHELVFHLWDAVQNMEAKGW